MAQSEDTELRDLVIEALEKNGSLAKIRALLRANVFLAFEDECEKKHNPSLDNILKLPEGILSLSIVHEFLEFCNLKNTLFVYMSETRQGKEYTYEGKKNLEDKFNNCNRRDNTKEPLLVSIVKNLLKRKFYEQNDNTAATLKDEQNCTYIVHEDTSSTSSQSNSHSDQSSDEKNKLRLRLPLDNSDTDTSTDSARDKTSSEYIPNEHIVIKDESDDDNNSNLSQHSGNNDTKCAPKIFEQELTTAGKDSTLVPHLQFQLNDLVGNNSSESTSYLDFKPFKSVPEKMLNTTGLPVNETVQNKKFAEDKVLSPIDGSHALKFEPESPATLSNVTTISSKNMLKKSVDETTRTDSNMNTPEYSYDFTISSPSKYKEKQDEHQIKSLDSVQNHPTSDSKNMNVESPHQNSQSSQSSVSISDVADLIELSEANSPMFRNKENNEGQNSSNLQHKSSDIKSNDNVSKVHGDDSGDFSGSPIPSLSNMSLDFNND